VLFNPVLDLKGKWERQFGMSLERVSPIDLVNGSLPPTIIQTGTADAVVPVEIAREFVRKAKAEGASNINLIEYPGRRHGFYYMRNNGDFDATINETIRFFKNLGWL
jgi:acetyl esterase/lipase